MRVKATKNNGALTLFCHDGFGRRVQYGFTLLEFLLVIVLLGILSVFLIPRFLSPDPFALAAAQRELVSALHYAQQLSLAKGVNACVRFSVALNDYGVEIDPDKADGCSAYVLASAPGGGSYPMSWPYGVSSSVPTTLVFDSLGNLVPANDVVIELTSGGENLLVCVSGGGFAYMPVSGSCP